MFEFSTRNTHPSLKLALLLAVVVSLADCSVSIRSTEQDAPNKLALKDQHSHRFKRQGSSAPAQSTINTKQNNPSEGTDSVTNSRDLNNEEEKAQDETLSSFKCDFGTSDAPDLCKFKILDSANPLSKGLSTWSLGSGKLALYQGGPLTDASERNDTTGGYIYYETSNPFAPNQSAPNPLGAQQHGSIPLSHQVYDSTRFNVAKQAGRDETSASMRVTHRNEPLHNLDVQFQHISSARVSVGAQNLAGPAFISPNLTAPGPSGMCLSFQYAIKGLSAEELKIFVNDHKTERSRQIWASSESAANNWTRGEVLYSVNNVHSLMFSASGLASSASRDLIQRKFRGYVALDEIEINKHDSQASVGACKGHCNFDGDLCGWTNAENGPEDDFDWSFGRGSDNLFTGPARDYISSMNNELTGSYLYTDAGYPRRPGDKAILVSPMFQPTAVNDAMCMRFAVHMFGSGIGSLAIKIRYADDSTSSNIPPPAGGGQATKSDAKMNGDLIIWEMSADAGNSWHQAQTSVSSSKSPFQVLLEGVIGENHLGNIAIDEISFSSGPCPTSPPVASKNYGDCTFEQSMCYWRNPDADIHLDDLDWIRSADEQSIHGPNFDHTLKKRSGSYLKLENTLREPKSGTRAFLLSPIFQPKPQGSVQCLSFYYYMFMRSVGSSGPNLGTIRVYLASNNELVPIWRLTNPISSPNWKHGRASLSTAIVDGQPTAPTKLFQIAFEGIWGDAAGGAIALDDITVFDGACDIMPTEAKSVPGECTFDADMCSWTNKTSDAEIGPDSIDTSRSPFLQSVSSASGHSSARLTAGSAPKRVSWQLATIDSRPVNLQDHTYKAPIGYVYVDVLDGSSQRMNFLLQSAEITVQAGQQISQCLSFWFAAYGRQDNNQLSIYLTQASAPSAAQDEQSATSNSPRSDQTSSTGNAQPNSNVASQAAASSAKSQTSSPPASSNGDSAENETSSQWKQIDGKLIWSISLRNITDMNRRKWQYGQVSLKADSNYITKFIAMSIDGGFALDDISYYDGSCETRPAIARVGTDEETNGGDTIASKLVTS